MRYLAFGYNHRGSVERLPMSEPTSSYSTATLTVQTTQDEDTLPPPWLAKALLIAQLWRASGLVDRLQQQVSVECIVA